MKRETSVARMMRGASLLSLILFACFASARAQSGGSYQITQSVIPGGGGTSTNGSLALTGTIGQGIVGTSSGGSYTLDGGFGQPDGQPSPTPSCATITINPAALPPGIVGTAYASPTFSASGANGNVTFTLTSGSLPAGMSFTNNSLSGTPTQTGSFPITITATDANSCTGSQAYTLIIGSNITAGNVIISEFRTRGANGSQDEFIEFYNNTDAPLTVGAVDGSRGWALSALDGTGASASIIFVIPNGTAIPARGHYLAINGNACTINGTSTPCYSLTNYGGNGNAASDALLIPDNNSPGNFIQSNGYLSDIPDNIGLALFRAATSSNFTAANRLDAVGFAGVTSTLYKEGATGLQPSTGITTDSEHSFVRNQNSSLPADTGDNAADFVLVATDPASMTSATAVLGAPAPENSTSPVLRNSQFSVSFPAGVAASLRTTTPVTNGSLGTLSLRRRFTNLTGQAITKLRFRVTDTTTINSPLIYSPQAQVRALQATLAGLAGTTVQATTLEQPPMQPTGGGVNSGLVINGSLTLSSPLPNNASVEVEFLLGVMQSGKYRFIITIEAAP